MVQTKGKRAHSASSHKGPPDTVVGGAEEATTPVSHHTHKHHVARKESHQEVMGPFKSALREANRKHHVQGVGYHCSPSNHVSMPSSDTQHGLLVRI